METIWQSLPVLSDTTQCLTRVQINHKTEVEILDKAIKPINMGFGSILYNYPDFRNRAFPSYAMSNTIVVHSNRLAFLFYFIFNTKKILETINQSKNALNRKQETGNTPHNSSPHLRLKLFLGSRKKNKSVTLPTFYNNKYSISLLELKEEEKLLKK